MKKFLVVLLAFVMVFAMAACGGGSNEPAEGGDTAVEPIELKFSISGPETSTWYDGAAKFAELLDEYTGGAYKVTIYANDQLSGGNQAGGIELVQNGSTDCHIQDSLVWSSICDKVIVPAFPWLLPTYEDVDKYMAGAGGEALKAALNEKGVVCIGIGENGYRQVVNNRNPITAPADMAGLKMRVPGSEVHVGLLKYIGADPLTMNQSEVFNSLQTGTIDACENTLDLLYSQNTLEAVKYLTMWNYSYDPIFLTVSTKLWDSLDDETKAAFEKAGQEAMDYEKQVTREKVENLLTVIPEEYPNVEIIDELTPEQVAAFQEKVAPIYDDYKDKLGADLFEAFGYTFS